ncbi:hypothetical protein [Mycolicibacterium llatzerense]|uniref:hypothetical protein n=1 Tax=Mycolicibacterium llatzerense TaxID=280871 RepID=UPI0013A6F11C|nr:hypothetical protein [Mycolicibacterium llatzerense]
MSAGKQGRRAALPPAGYSPRPRRRSGDSLVVRFVPENPAEAPRDYDFSTLKVSSLLQKAFADSFTERTRTGAGIRTNASAEKTWTYVRRFSEYLTDLKVPPLSPADLTTAHLRGWYLTRSELASKDRELGNLKSTLRKVEGLSVAFRDSLNERNPIRETRAPTVNYSRAENQRILRAARSDIRNAARRIGDNRALLGRWRAGDLDSLSEQDRQLGELLDYIDINTDVPRYAASQRQPRPWVARLGSVDEHLTRLHLSAYDVAAFAVLLVGLTGQNPSTITRAPAPHHRPDGYAGGIASAVIKLDKPRRGARRYMDVPLTAVPPWAQHGMTEEGEPQPGSIDQNDWKRLDLTTPFGVFQLLCDLAAPARQHIDSDRLFVWWSNTGGMGVGRGFRTQLHSELIRAWSVTHGLPADAKSTTLAVTLARMRLTFNELQQRPVAHTEKTLANEYLARNRGNILEYRKVVTDVLAAQVRKADTRARMGVLSPEDIAEARTDPYTVAARHNMDVDTLSRLVSGELDTVLGACVDNTNSPYSDKGDPCRASFMMCLSCSCARATPEHLPLQVAVHDQLIQRKAEVTPLRWAQRFALPCRQLADLLDRAGAVAVDDARAAMAPTNIQVAQRFLDRELDLT